MYTHTLTPPSLWYHNISRWMKILLSRYVNTDGSFPLQLGEDKWIRIDPSLIQSAKGKEKQMKWQEFRETGSDLLTKHEPYVQISLVVKTGFPQWDVITKCNPWDILHVPCTLPEDPHVCPRQTCSRVVAPCCDLKTWQTWQTLTTTSYYPSGKNCDRISTSNTKRIFNKLGLLFTRPRTDQYGRVKNRHSFQLVTSVFTRHETDDTTGLTVEPSNKNEPYVQNSLVVKTGFPQWDVITKCNDTTSSTREWTEGVIVSLLVDPLDQGRGVPSVRYNEIHDTHRLSRKDF